MSAPAPVAADTAGNTSIQQAPPQKISNVDSVIKHRYSRVFEHYVSNSMDAYGYSEASTGGFIDAMMIDEGWHYIPYANPGVAMRPQDLLHIGAEGTAIRVDKLGYEIKHAQIMRQELIPASGVTTINNSFSSQPYFELYEDNLHKWDTLIENRPANATTFPDHTMGVPPTLMPNKNMTVQEVTRMQDAMLQRCVWCYKKSGTGNDASWNQDDIVSQVSLMTGADPWEIYSSMNEQGRTLVGQRDIIGHKHEWTNSQSNQWYPIRMPINATEWALNAGLEDKVPGTIPVIRANLLTGSSMPNSNGAVSTRGTNLPNFKHNIWQPLNLESAVPHAPLNLPTDSYIKIQRLLDQEGPINIYARIVIEYFCEISVLPNDSGFNFNTLTASYGTGGDTPWIATSLTTGMARRFSSWGLPNLTTTPPLGSEYSYSKIYQPATFTSVGRKRLRDSSMVEEGDKELESNVGARVRKSTGANC